MLLQELLKKIPAHSIALSSWIYKQGISISLLQHYKRSKWLIPLGGGAYYRVMDNPTIDGGMYALQAQAGKTVHYGGRYALSRFYGIMHFVRVRERAQIYVEHKHDLPKWFVASFENEYDSCVAHFLPPDLGIREFQVGDMTIRVSSRERAILEMLYSVPQLVSTKEAFQIMEGLFDLVPQYLNELFSQCTSVKVKKLFLYMFSYYEDKPPFFKYLDMNNFQFKNTITIVDKNGILNRNLQLKADEIGEI